MAKGPKGFSEVEKENLRSKLCLECENMWSIHGYKKTSIGELTVKVGISTGAFYLLYGSKEELFCETLASVQQRLKDSLLEIIDRQKGKVGFVEAMKWHYREYNRTPFLYGAESADFLSFINRMPAERIAQIEFDGVAFFYETIEHSGLKLKVPKEKAYQIINMLLSTVALKDRFHYDYLSVFDFLIDSVVDELFE